MSSQNTQNNNVGTEEWVFNTGGIIQSSPTVVDGTVYVGSNDNHLYAVNMTTGTQEWVFETGDFVYSTPTVVDGTVYVGSNDNSLYAVDATTGTQEWVFETGDWVDTSPTVVDRMVYVGSKDNKLYAVDAATGTQEWAFTTEDWVRSSPAVVDGTVYIGCNDYNLYAVDSATGDQQWAYETRGWVFSSPTVADGTVYVGSNDNSLYAIDVATGTKQWSFETGDAVVSTPTVADGTVYVGSNDNSLYAIDATAGTPKWVFETGDRVSSSPTVVDGTVYVGCEDNNLYAVDVTTGIQEWIYETGDWVFSSPTVVGGTVYVGSNDNSLHAITASAGAENKEQIPTIEETRSPERRALSFADFQTIEAIGEGGQAVIKKARLADSKAPPEVVAIRQVPTSSTVAREAIEQFQTRSEIWETIDARERDKRKWRDSEHIVGVINTGDEPFPWIAMEYMDGGDLAELLEEHPDGLHVRQALWIGECVCKGLKIAHKLGKCHLDVKPENVLLKQTDGWPWPKIADWGLARNLAKETGTVSALSPEYAAPEQLDSGKLADPDQLTDIYQTGTVVYALLTGDPPMSEGSIEPPSEQRSKLSAEVDAVVELALAQEKTDRYDSIANFRKALTAIRTGERLPREVVRRAEK